MNKIIPQEDEVLFTPIGGCNEIGRNLSLYGHNEAWIIVDCGIGFPPANLQGGIDAILPNPEFLYKNAERIKGLLITHAHEDHLGSIPYLWGGQLHCPIFATDFAVRLLQKKWQNFGKTKLLDIRTITIGKRFSVSPFMITALPVAHSVPEATAFCIETPCGILLHTGDWKLDQNPVVGKPASKNLFDLAISRAKAQQLPLLAMMCDSTNIFSNSSSGDEGSTQPAFEELFKKNYKRIVVTLFASNIARTISIARAARNCGRRLLIAGNALLRMTEIARSCGYIEEIADTILDTRAHIPTEKSVLLATGSQGESGSFMSRLAQPNSPLTHGDVAVFSSRTIPGNEIAVGKIKNAMVSKGVEIIDHNRIPSLHVSGHATREEVESVYKRLQPSWLVPIHGEPRHLQENARIARKLGLKTQIVTNGHILRFRNNIKGVTCETLPQLLPIEEQYLERVKDKAILLAQSNNNLKERSLLSKKGACSCFVAINRNNSMVVDPTFIVFGDDKLERILTEQGVDILRDAIDFVEKKRNKKKLIWENQHINTRASNDDDLQQAFKKEVYKKTGRSPLIKMLIKRN